MAKIGSPLVPSERPSVQEPVFASSAGKISSNVARQKINLMDGTHLREAYVSKAELQGEMFNMVAARAEDWDTNRKLNEKKDQLAIEKEYSDLKIDHTQQFGSARTAQQKSDIRDSYTTGLGKLNKRVEGLGLTTLKDRSWAQKYAIDGRATGADFAIKSKHALYTETISNMNVKMATLEREAANKANVDPQRILNEGVSELEEMYELGAITKPQLAEKVKNFQHNVTLKRATLLATLHARAIRDDPSALPSMEELLSGLEGQLGMVLPEELREPVGKAFTNAYLAEISDGNRATLHAEKVADANYSIDRAKTMSDMKGHIRSGSANNEIFQRFYDEAIAMGDIKGARIIKQTQLDWNSNTVPNGKILSYFTKGDGFQEFISDKPDNTPSDYMDGMVINVDKAMEYIRNVPVGSSFDTNDEATLLAIETKLHEVNNATKSNQIQEHNVLRFANLYLTNRLNKKGTNNKKNREKLQDYFGVSQELIAKYETNGTQLTNTEWGTAMYKHSETYIALIQTVTSDIKRESIETREREGLYSSKGFARPSHDWNKLHGIDIQKRVAALIDGPPYVPSPVSHSVLNTTNKMVAGNDRMPSGNQADLIKDLQNSGLNAQQLNQHGNASTATTNQKFISDVNSAVNKQIEDDKVKIAKDNATRGISLSPYDFDEDNLEAQHDANIKQNRQALTAVADNVGNKIAEAASTVGDVTIKAGKVVASTAVKGAKLLRDVSYPTLQAIASLDPTSAASITGDPIGRVLPKKWKDLVELLTGVEKLVHNDMIQSKEAFPEKEKPKEIPQPQAKGYDPSSAFTNENLSKAIEEEVIPAITNLIVGGGDPSLVDTDLIPRDADGMPSVSPPDMSGVPARRPKPKPKPKPPHQRGVKTTKEWNPKTKKFE